MSFATPVDFHFCHLFCDTSYLFILYTFPWMIWCGFNSRYIGENKQYTLPTLMSDSSYGTALSRMTKTFLLKKYLLVSFIINTTSCIKPYVLSIPHVDNRSRKRRSSLPQSLLLSYKSGLPGPSEKAAKETYNIWSPPGSLLPVKIFYCFRLDLLSLSLNFYAWAH